MRGMGLKYICARSSLLLEEVVGKNIVPLTVTWMDAMMMLRKGIWEGSVCIYVTKVDIFLHVFIEVCVCITDCICITVCVCI